MIIETDTFFIHSAILDRNVIIDCYYPSDISLIENLSLLLVNDGQDLRTMNFTHLLCDVYANNKLRPLLTVAIHCSTDRKNEYGTANILDYKGRGAKSALFTQFVVRELLAYVRNHYRISAFFEKAYAGFSLGGLSALDIVWNHPHEFSKAGIFSGSFWWRDLSADDPAFDEKKNLIMQRQIREGNYYEWLQFFFEVGSMDETADRNNNGIIDSIDDTLLLIDELEQKGYRLGKNIRYIELTDGKHNIETWARVFPEFLIWAFGKN